MIKNPSPVLLDRLSHVLDRQGFKLKRQQLLETAAYAFGHRNGDAFSAAAKAGELTPPSVVPVGRVRLATGETVLIVNDPLANSAYGIDESFVESSMDERREHIGVTPYGHLVSITDLTDTTIPDLAGTTRGDAALIGHISDAIRELDGYTAEDDEVDNVGQTENLLGRALAHAESGDVAGAREKLRVATDVLDVICRDDADRHVHETQSAILKAIAHCDRDEGRGVDDSPALAGIMRDMLARIDEGIASLKLSGEKKRELERITSQAHAALQIAGRIDILSENDPESIRVSRDDLHQVIGAAQSWAEDINTGLEDGTYDDDAGVEDVEASIDTLQARLDMEPSPAARAAVHKPKPNQMTIHIGTITHRHGEDVMVSLSADGLDHEIAEYCRENWSDVMRAKGMPGNPIGMTDSDIVSAYFDACGRLENGQYVDRSSQDVPIPGQMIAAGGECARCGSGLVFGMCSDETCPFHDVPQTDQRGWSGHPGMDPFPKDDHVPVTAPKALEGKPADWAEQIAQALEDGAVADVWYDAHSFGEDSPDDPDRIAEGTINETQQAMQEAARILRELKPIRLPDGKIMIDGRIPSPERIDRRAAAAAADEPLWITDSDGDDTGQATLTMLHEARIGYQCENGDFHPLTTHEQEMSLPCTTLNADCDNIVRMGFTVLWRGRKWYAPEVQFAWDENQSFKDDGDDALARAKAYMEDIRPMVESIGGHLRLDEYPTDFAHELAVLLPVELAESTGDPDDWKAALSYLLMTSKEKARRPQAKCEFTAEANFHKYTMSVDPLGDTVWDATFDALRWGTRDAISIITGETDPDEYARSPLAPEWVRKWAGTNPFDVQVIGLKECLNIIM